MEPDISNMTLNEYLMYQGRHKGLERSYASLKSVVPVRNRILVEENINIAEEKEEVPMKDVEMDENHDIDHSGTKEALQCSFAENPFLVVMELNDQSSFLLHTIPSFISNEVEVCGVMLGQSLATGKHFKSTLVGYHAEDDDGIFVIIDVAQGSRLGAWLRACCLFIIPSKSRGVFRFNSTLIFNFHFLNVQ
nr:hypothetical protein [Tanacetum cinerariifolium]